MRRLFPRGLRSLGRVRTKRMVETESELAFYLEMRVRELVGQGVPPDRAERMAREAFGDAGSIYQQCIEIADHEYEKESGVRNILTTLRQNVAYAFRSVRRSPAFACTMISVLALGIGLNTAIFSVFNAVLLRPVPGVQQANDLVTVRVMMQRDGQGVYSHSYPLVEVLNELETLDGLAGVADIPLNVALDEASTPTRLSGEIVGGDYFGVLHLRPYFGRLFHYQLDARTADRDVVISHALWSSRMGGDSSAIGRSISVNGQPFTVIGVTPKGFRGAALTADSDLWIAAQNHRDVLPFYPNDLLDRSRNGLFMKMVGRLAPSASMDQVQAEIDVMVDRFKREGAPQQMRGSAWPVVSEGLNAFPWEMERLRFAHRLLTGVVVLVLLIACANAANLFLARGMARRRELAVRRALGASVSRVVGQQLTEALVISLIAGVFGLMISAVTRDFFVGMRIVSSTPAVTDVPLDTRVIMFTLVASLITGLVFGVWPALRAARQDLGHSFSDRSGGMGPGSRARKILAGGQFSISLLLIVVSGLLLKTAGYLTNIELGFDGDDILSLSIDPAGQGYDEEQRKVFLGTLLRDINDQPEIAVAALTWKPTFGQIGGSERFVVDRTGDPEVPADVNSISHGYFEVFDARVVAGRTFNEADLFQANAPSIAVVNRTMAEALWPSQSPIGRTIYRSWDSAFAEPIEIVGVVEPLRIGRLLADVGPQLFEPVGQEWVPNFVAIEARLNAPFEAGLSAIRESAKRLDPTLPAYDEALLSQRARDQFAENFTLARTTSALAMSALFLTAIGLFGVMAYAVGLRRREIGIRLAIGAEPPAVLRLVIGEGLVIAGVGTVAGLAVSALVVRVVASKLHGVGIYDVSVLAMAGVVLGSLAVLASVVPARRAMKFDPALVLRDD